jgi:hypothetical protein
MIAANGMLLLHQALVGGPSSSIYLDGAISISKDTVKLSLVDDQTPFYLKENGMVDVVEPGFESILKNATANNSEHAIMRYSDHGLVYADYYFLELGNKLLRMGLV